MLAIHWERGGHEGEKGQVPREQKNRAREKTAEAAPLQILPQWMIKKKKASSTVHLRKKWKI